MFTYNAYFAIVLIPKKYMGLSSLLPDKQIQESKKKKKTKLFSWQKNYNSLLLESTACVCVVQVCSIVCDHVSALFSV